MDDEGGDAGLAARLDQGEQGFARMLVVNADAALDGGRDIGHLAHRLHRVGHELRLAHQAAPNDPDCTRSDGQPQLRLTSS